MQRVLLIVVELGHRNQRGAHEEKKSFLMFLAPLSSRGTVARCCSQRHRSLPSGGCREGAPAADVSEEADRAPVGDEYMLKGIFQTF